MLQHTETLNSLLKTMTSFKFLIIGLFGIFIHFVSGQYQPISTAASTVPIFEFMTCGVERLNLYCTSRHPYLDVVRIEKAHDNDGQDLDGSGFGQRYDSVDLVFDGGEYNVTDVFFENINQLFSRRPQDGKVEFKAKFQNFRSLHLNDYFLNSICAGLINNTDSSDSHTSKDYLDESEPQKSCHIVLNVYNSKGADFYVSPFAFQNLKATSLVIHNANIDDSNRFQTLFNNADLDLLDLKGTYIENDDKLPFHGRIGKVLLTKQASRLDADEFPKFPTQEYSINAQNIQSINGKSFVDYENVKELELKSKSLVIRHGDLASFSNLKKLHLEDVIVDSEGLSDLDNLEEINVLNGVSMRSGAISELGHFKHLKKINFKNSEQTGDVRMMCELATAINQLLSSSQIEDPSALAIDISPAEQDKCTCEHKYIARITGLSNHQCYNFNAVCTQTSCQVVDQHFKEQYNSLNNNDVTEMEADQEDTSSKDPKYTEANIQSDDSGLIASDGPAESIQDIDDDRKSTGGRGAKASRMNWLPIVIVTGILLLILACGIIAYLLRMFSERRREFKPIPSNEAGFITTTGTGSGGAAKN